MDRVLIELLNNLVDLLRQILTAHERLLDLATTRRESMRHYNLELLNKVMEREQQETTKLLELDRQRQGLVAQFRKQMPKGMEPTTSEIARAVPEPFKTQILGLAGSIRSAAEKLQRENNINQSASQSLAGSFARMIKIITGVTQHAGVYMRNGRRAAMAPVQLLDAVA